MSYNLLSRKLSIKHCSTEQVLVILNILFHHLGENPLILNPINKWVVCSSHKELISDLFNYKILHSFFISQGPKAVASELKLA